MIYKCPLKCGWTIELSDEDIQRSGMPECPEHKLEMKGEINDQHLQEI